jgi:signal transduction histidine kinase
VVVEEEHAQGHPDIVPPFPNPVERHRKSLPAGSSVRRVPYAKIEDPSKLRRVLQATLLIQADLELGEVLRHVVEEACSMTGARYGALGVLDTEKRALSDFVTVGVTREQEQAIGTRPTGRGLLGALIGDPRPLRVADIGLHPEHLGFPPNHPPMTSFLGVPIMVRDQVYGNLYLTDKAGWTEFTEDDSALVEALSLAAGIVIENARLNDRLREAAVFEDRDRVARDLHDTVIQRLFAIGLTLQGLAGRLPDGLAGQVVESVQEIDQVISQVRSTIFELGSGPQSRGVRDEVTAMVHGLSPVVGSAVRLSMYGPVDTLVSPRLQAHLLATLREALTNVGKHAQATRVDVDVTVDAETCRLTVTDDGVGIGAFDPLHEDRDGLGLVNLRRRAEKLDGAFSVQDAPAGGTVLSWAVPIEN